MNKKDFLRSVLDRLAVVPTARELNANPHLTGKGVRIAFLDSGFYPLPDYSDRVLSFYDVSGEEKEFGEVKKPLDFHWHGSQTVISCAGNGSLSEGLYSGIASQSELVLVKVSGRDGRISDANIEKGLRWVIDNCAEYGIRIANMSFGGDRDLRTTKSKINQLSDELVNRGVTVTVAAGNSAESHSIPPASAPSVITVGGFTDENSANATGFDLYHSDFGRTADGLIKPEILGPAMFVAAPILPNTDEYLEAEILFSLISAPNQKIGVILSKNWKEAGLSESILSEHDMELVREMSFQEIQRRKLISPFYQSVDGTSFAAPISASVVAQMLEANPKLSPLVIKNILVSTAARIADRPSIRQGYGVLNAKLAVERSLTENHTFDHKSFRPPYISGNKIIFSHHDDSAKEVSLVGSFNNWEIGKVEFKKDKDGIWRASIPCLPGGVYKYKYVVDGTKWIEDPTHGYKERDGYNGFNSILVVE